MDIRVDDSPRPLVELRRLLDLTRAYDKMNEGDGLLAQRKFDEAAAVYRDASKLAPGNMEILFWYAVTLVSVGEVDRSLPVFKGIFQEDDSWRTLVPRLVKSELLPDNPETIQKIVNQ